MESDLAHYTDRPLQAGDESFVVGLHRLAHVAAFMHCPSESRVAEMVRDASVRGRVILDSEKRPIGFMAMSAHDGWLVEIHGIVVATPGAGVGRWALRQAVRWAFVEVGAHRIWLEVTAANSRARRLYESEGFVHEGTYRDGYRSSAGRYEDLAHYGILRAEWTTLHVGAHQNRSSTSVRLSEMSDDAQPQPV